MHGEGVGADRSFDACIVPDPPCSECAPSHAEGEGVEGWRQTADRSFDACGVPDISCSSELHRMPAPLNLTHAHIHLCAFICACRGSRASMPPSIPHKLTNVCRCPRGPCRLPSRPISCPPQPHTCTHSSVRCAHSSARAGAPAASPAAPGLAPVSARSQEAWDDYQHNLALFSAAYSQRCVPPAHPACHPCPAPPRPKAAAARSRPRPLAPPPAGPDAH